MLHWHFNPPSSTHAKFFLGIITFLYPSLHSFFIRQIQQSLQTLPDVSLLIIAHRLRTIQKADNILVLEGGYLVEQGTHEELVEKKEGVYQRLCHGNLLQNGDNDVETSDMKIK